MDNEKLTNQLVDWLRVNTLDAKAEGLILGISGGVDSAVAAVLAKRAFPDNCLGIFMPCETLATEMQHAQLLADQFTIETLTFDLIDLYRTAIGQMRGHLPPSSSDLLAQGNIKSRLRMMTLYYFAQVKNYLVLGTSNRSEFSIGYTTKYGDSAVDLQVLGGLLKCEVYDLARYLNVPPEIINKPPSAGLWEGQTDEIEIGFTYQALDHYLLTGQGEEDTIARIEARMCSTQHKRSFPPIPDFTA